MQQHFRAFQRCLLSHLHETPTRTSSDKVCISCLIFYTYMIPQDTTEINGCKLKQKIFENAEVSKFDMEASNKVG